MTRVGSFRRSAEYTHRLVVGSCQAIVLPYYCDHDEAVEVEVP